MSVFLSGLSSSESIISERFRRLFPLTGTKVHSLSPSRMVKRSAFIPDSPPHPARAQTSAPATAAAIALFAIVFICFSKGFAIKMGP